MPASNPELLNGETARRLLEAYARAEKLAAFGVAALARKIDDASHTARLTGMSAGEAKAVVATGKTMSQADDLSAALQRGRISLDQAAEIASAEESAPGAAGELVAVAQIEAFHVLKHRARTARLEAEQHRDLGARQRAARCARSHRDDLGMVHIHVALEPHTGTPIVARAEAEAARLGRTARAQQKQEPFERHLADAYASLLAGAGTGRARRPELVVLVSHEVVKRGWRDVTPGELCKIPGVGPVAPQVARDIAKDAFLSGVFFDGKDLRNFARWTRTIPIEVAIALELGDAPEFDGVCCVECGKRFHTEFDHPCSKSTGDHLGSRHTARRTWAGVEPQSQAALLELPSSQDGARSAGREAQTRRTLTQLWPTAAMEKGSDGSLETESGSCCQEDAHREDQRGRTYRQE